MKYKRLSMGCKMELTPQICFTFPKSYAFANSIGANTNTTDSSDAPLQSNKYSLGLQLKWTFNNIYILLQSKNNDFEQNQNNNFQINYSVFATPWLTSSDVLL